MRDRSVSPLGASRFERPYTPRSRASPTSATTTHSKHGFGQPINRPSTSQWSASDSQGYSTAASSVHQPVEREVTPPRELGMKSELRLDEHDEAEHQHDQDEWYAEFDAGDYDFDGDLCPDSDMLAATYDIPVFAAEGHSIPFGTLHDPETALKQRQMIVFIRHFFCGACQAYVKAISEQISAQEYFAMSIPTSIIVIGCGKPDLIPFYREVTGTAFPIFADPSRKLFKKLGMVLSTKIGKGSPEYMRGMSNHDWIVGQVKTFREGLRARQELKKLTNMKTGTHASTSSLVDRHSEDDAMSLNRQELNSAILERREALARAKAIRKRDIVRGGHPLQIGGEFLFEDGAVVWCHRMRHYRDHVEVARLRKLLCLDE